jgi:hypothetical protein
MTYGFASRRTDVLAFLVVEIEAAKDSGEVTALQDEDRV